MGFKLQAIDNLFPTPLLRFEVADADALNRRLLEEIAVRRRAEKGLVRSNFGGWHSDNDFFARTEPAHRELAAELLGLMADATRRFDPKADFGKIRLVPDGWINVNPPSAYNGPHDHKTAFWSGSYYVDVPAGEGASGMIEFLTPVTPLPSGGLIGGPLVAETFGLTPVPGTVLLFPATLLHWVHPNHSNRERVTIAFNGRFQPKAKGPRVTATVARRRS